MLWAAVIVGLPLGTTRRERDEEEEEKRGKFQ